MNQIDFARTQLRFSTTRVNDTPRLNVDAVCTLTEPAKGPRRYFLTCACIGEAMYVREGLIHEPVHEFNLIAAPGREFMMIKRYANASLDMLTALTINDTMPTHDGRGAKVVELEVSEVFHAAVQRIEDYAAFREALLGGKLINGRTSYTTADGLRVTLDYPARTVNVAHEQEAWQVDAGPILMPLSLPTNSTRLIERLDMAFLVFNCFDYAEAGCSTANLRGREYSANVGRSLQPAPEFEVSKRVVRGGLKVWALDYG